MRRYSIMYFISQSFKGLWRNGVMTLASITVLLSCLVVMGSFALIVANLNENLDSLGDFNCVCTAGRSGSDFRSGSGRCFQDVLR